MGSGCQYGQPKTSWKVKLLLLLSFCVNLGYLATWLVSAAPSPAADLADGLLSGCDGSHAFATGVHEGRQLGGSDGQSDVEPQSSSGHSSSGGHGGGHPHDAMLFLLNAIVIGAAVMHLSSLFHEMQETVTVFILGVLFSLVFEGLKLKDNSGVFGHSYIMWMDIDPHLLLFTLLPALLAGDAMTIDTTVAKRVAYQCLYLAGPGVLINAFLSAGFLMWYLDWSFLLSLVTASILCATDPVAVVALLKELGASPVLTVQIQGESLLNDGTAMVLYMVAYDFLKGNSKNVHDILMFLVKTAMMAVALGAFTGYFFLSWIRLASNKFNHSSSMIQIVLTICCAYWSFIIAEGVFHMSGVLATVASSLVLAHHMWPHIVSPHSMKHVWHTIESLGNIIIFFLAGALTGKAMAHIDPINFLLVIGIYIFATLARGALIFASRPLLRLLNTDRAAVSLADATVMTWGGLRGAVGLAMALRVYKERGADSDGVYQISEENAQLVLFHVSAVAFLTTIINATTAPALVHKLGITAPPSEQLRLLRFIYEQLVWVSQDASHPQEVTDNLIRMLNGIKDAVEIEKAKKLKKRTKRSQSALQQGLNNVGEVEVALQGNNQIIERLKAAEDQYKQHNIEDLRLMGDLPTALLGRVDDMVDLLRDSETDVDMARVINKRFLNMVYTNYWHMIEKGQLRPGREETDMLLTSVRVASSCVGRIIDLTDFDFIQKHMAKTAVDMKMEDLWNAFPDDYSDAGNDDGQSSSVTGFITEVSPADISEGITSSRQSAARRKSRRCGLRALVRSVFFNVGMAVAIAINSIYVAIEEAMRGDDEEGGVWLVIEIIFASIFTVEFGLKFIDRRWKYFKSASNVFDFVLVVFGIVGVALSLGQNVDSGGSNEARLLKITRIFRVLRFLRVFRLLNARLSNEKEVSPEVGKHLQRILTLACFANAHCKSQMSLIKYFGVNGKIDEPEERELARCVLQSQLSVYRAFNMAYNEEKDMDPALIQEIRLVTEKKGITENLHSFIMDAYEDGAISAREAESILHPLARELEGCLSALHDFTDGIWSNQKAMQSKFEEKEKKKMGIRTSRRQEGADLNLPLALPGSIKDDEDGD